MPPRPRPRARPPVSGRARPQDLPDLHPLALARTRAPAELLCAMHVLAGIEEGREAAFMIARVARRAELSEARRASLVHLTYGALRSLNRLDRAVQTATHGPPGALATGPRQLLRLAALMGESGASIRDLFGWTRVVAGSLHAGKDLESAAKRAAGAAQYFARSRPSAKVEDVALREGHPEWFVGLARELLGPEAKQLLAANNEEPPLILRTNTLKGTRDELIAALKRERFDARPTRFSPLGVEVAQKIGIFRTRAFQDGLFEMQDEGSQLVGLLVSAKPSEWVLDACAGAGGKTLLLSAEMQNKGHVVALDVNEKRLLDLARRAQRAGVFNHEPIVIDPEGRVRGHAKALRGNVEDKHARLPRQVYDRVLVDAPCSGLGTFRRTPELRWRQTPDSVATYPPRQTAILAQWGKVAKLGGRVVYATCTIHPDENENVVSAFLGAQPKFKLVNAGEALPAGVPKEGLVDAHGFLRLWPHRQGTEGFFGAVLECGA